MPHRLSSRGRCRGWSHLLILRPRRCKAHQKNDGGHVPPLGVTAHGGPSGPLQFDRFGSRPWPPALAAPFGTQGKRAVLAARGPARRMLLSSAQAGVGTTTSHKSIGSEDIHMAKIKTVMAGVLGGLAGAALMGPVHMAAAKLSKLEPSQGEDATEKVAVAVAKQVAGQRLTRSGKKRGGQIVHFAFGAGVGALYGLLAEHFSPVRLGAGALFGIAVYAGAHALTVPALGLAPGPAENGPVKEAPELASHVVYGLVTHAVSRLIA